MTPKVDALTAQWGDDGATRGAAYIEMRDLARELEHQNAELVKDVQAKQAEIDRLMLEYCPSEMTPEQLEEWGKHQRKAAAPHQQMLVCDKQSKEKDTE